MQIVFVAGCPAVFNWADGLVFRREETLLEIARKSEDHLLQVCLWLENHGQKEEALGLLERLVR